MAQQKKTEQTPDQIIESVAKPLTVGQIEDMESGRFDELGTLGVLKEIFSGKKEYEQVRNLPMNKVPDLLKRCYEISHGPDTEEKDGKNS